MELVNYESVALEWNAKGDNNFAIKMVSADIFEAKSYNWKKKWKKLNKKVKALLLLTGCYMGLLA